MFVSAMNHYAKTNDIEWKWKAQSLLDIDEMKEKFKQKVIFGDAYNIIGENTDNWDFGPLNNGDITNYNNMNHYIEMTKRENINLVSFDCGSGASISEDYINKENQMLYINFCQMVIVLLGLKKGSTIILKLFLPLTHLLTLKYIQFIYQSFKSVSIYKPSLNPCNGEIYLVAINKHPLKKEIENNITNDIKLFRTKKLLEKLHIDDIDYNFLREHTKLMINFITLFQRNLTIKISLMRRIKIKDINDIFDDDMKGQYEEDYIKHIEIKKIKKTDLLIKML